MPTPTYDLIASNVLTSNPASITFSSIPATYRDLVLVSNVTSTLSVGGIDEIVNGDTGANYQTILMEGDSGSGLRTLERTRNQILHSWITGNTTNTNPSTHVTEFLDYATTNKHKPILIRVNSASQIVYSAYVRYMSTSAITSITIGTSNAAVGSSFYLYGIAS